MRVKATKARYAAEAGAKYTAPGMVACSEVCTINVNLDDRGLEDEPNWFGWITRFEDTEEGAFRHLSLPGTEKRPSAHTRQRLLKYLNHVARELGFKYGQVRDYSSKTSGYEVLGVVNL